MSDLQQLAREAAIQIQLESEGVSSVQDLEDGIGFATQIIAPIIHAALLKSQQLPNEGFVTRIAMYAEDYKTVEDWWSKLPGSHYPLYLRQLDPIASQLAALIRKAEAIPEGWQLVPKEPTHEMLVASRKALKTALADGRTTCAELSMGNKVLNKKQHYVKCRIRWDAMLAAVPQPPAEKE